MTEKETPRKLLGSDSKAKDVAATSETAGTTYPAYGPALEFEFLMESAAVCLPENPQLAGLLEKLRRDAERANASVAAFRLMHTKHGVVEYESFLKERLPGSGLAQLIPDGLEALPDIYARMPWWQRSIEQLRRPRNYGQLLEHLYDYLEWYLDPKRPVPRPRIWYHAALGALIVPLLGLLICALIQLVGGTGPPQWFMYSCVGGSLLAAILNFAITSGITRLSFAERQCRPYLNKLWLWKYLSSAYAPRDDS